MRVLHCKQCACLQLFQTSFPEKEVILLVLEENTLLCLV